MYWGAGFRDFENNLINAVRLPLEKDVLFSNYKQYAQFYTEKRMSYQQNPVGQVWCCAIRRRKKLFSLKSNEVKTFLKLHGLLGVGPL